MRRVGLLTNPASGKGHALESASIARRRLRELGVAVVDYEGANHEESIELSRAAVQDPAIDALAVCGGDGIIGAALQAQAGSGTPLGIIPAGTGNDHAREYRIPLDPARAAEVIAAGFVTTTDLGIMRSAEAGDRWFGTIVCCGFDSLVTDRTNAMAWPRGRARYTLAVLLEFLHFHAIDARIVLDDGAVVLDDPITLCSIGNTRTYGGGMQICPHADHHDGLLDLTVLSKLGRASAAVKFPKLLQGTFADPRSPEPSIATYRAKKVEITMPEINAYADGDRFAALPITVECVPGAGRYLVPRP